MKKLIYYLLLFILPVLFTIICFTYKQSIGEYYLDVSAFFVPNYDPSYVYLFGSLNLAQLGGYGTAFYQHPGIPNQIFGALIIKLIYAFSGTEQNVVMDVFVNPEYYLHLLNFIVLLLNTAAIFFLGIVAFKKTGNIYAALFLQLSPFGFSIVYAKFAEVTTEPFMVFLIILLITAMIAFIYEKDMTNKMQVKYLIIFGLLCGLGLSCKIIFLPVLIIPVFLLRRYLYKFLFLLISFVTFILLFISVVKMDNIKDFVNWVTSLFVHSGVHGSGEKNFIDVKNIGQYLDYIFLLNPVFLIAFFLIMIILIAGIFKLSKMELHSKRNFYFLLSIFLAMCMQVILVIKHFGNHYMIPAFLLSIPGMYMGYIVISDQYPGFLKNLKVRYAFIALFILYFAFYNFRIIDSNIKAFSFKRDQSRLVFEKVKAINDGIIVSTYGSTSKAYALNLGIWFTGSQRTEYEKILNKRYPNDVYYSMFDKNIVDPDGSIKKRLAQTKKLYFISKTKSTFDGFYESLKKYLNKPDLKYNVIIENPSQEGIYEFILL